MCSLSQVIKVFCFLCFCLGQHYAYGDDARHVVRRFLLYDHKDNEFDANLKRYHLKAGIYERRNELGIERLPFLLYRPAQKKLGMPMLLYFGGTGETGTDLSRHFNQRTVFERVTSDGFQSVHPCILFAPMLKDYRTFSGGLPEQPTECSDFVLEAMFGVIRHLGEGCVDTNRIYTTGLSFGGCAAFEMICYYPHIFAAALPISAVESEYMLPEFSRVNLWCIENRMSVSPMRKALYCRMKDRVMRTGGDFRMSIFPKKGHNAWDDAWNEDEPWNWLFSKKLGKCKAETKRKECNALSEGAVDLTSSYCSSDIDSCCASHKPIYGADNIDKTYFRAENARSGNWWMIEIKDGIFGDCVVQTGTEEGKDILRHGVVESSKDGRYWRAVAKIDAKTGRTSFRIVNPVKFIRIRVTGKGRQPLVVREVKVRQ